MKRINYNRKPIFFLSFLIVFILFSMTFALFYSRLVIPNEFTTATYNVIIDEEDFEDDFGPKKVYIRNEELTNAPAVIRVSYDEMWSMDDNGVYVVLSNKINNTDVVTKNWTNDWLNNFTYINGWYYYNKILSAGESVQILQSISKNQNVITSSYDDYDYKLSFSFESVQATTDAINSLWNLTPTISGSNVSWQGE